MSSRYPRSQISLLPLGFSLHWQRNLWIDRWCWPVLPKDSSRNTVQSSLTRTCLLGKESIVRFVGISSSWQASFFHSRRDPECCYPCPGHQPLVQLVHLPRHWWIQWARRETSGKTNVPSPAVLFLELYSWRANPSRFTPENTPFLGYVLIFKVTGKWCVFIIFSFFRIINILVFLCPSCFSEFVVIFLSSES